MLEILASDRAPDRLKSATTGATVAYPLSFFSKLPLRSFWAVLNLA